MYRILLVDDEALIREQVSENVHWEQYGYVLAGSCENGRDALEFIDRNPVDVVLTDICMPYLDGMQLSEKLSGTRPEIRIILLSGYDEFEYAKNAIRYGVKEYLLKPITASELGEVLLNLKEEMDRERHEKESLSRMKANYHKGQILYYSDILLNLIMGNKSEAESRRELAEAGVHLEAAVYRVAVVELDMYKRAHRLDEKQKKESALMAFVLYNISQEIVEGCGGGEVCQGKDQRTFILFHSDRRSDFKQRIRSICGDIIAQMNQIMQLSVNIGIGDCVCAMKEIYRSCEEAEKALDWHYVLGGNRVIESETLRTQKREENVEKLLSDLVLRVKENSVSGIGESIQALERLFREAMYDRRSIETVLQRVVDAMAGLMRMCDTADVYARDGQTALSQILAAGDLEEAAEKLCAFCEETGELLDSLRSKGGKRYAVMAMDYIEKNYADCNLSLQSVCSYLNISASRFSSIFKAATGTTFMDVLSGIRMKKARELLENTDLKNYEIAGRVGYNDPHYFSIVFKKTTGKSPTEYAREVRQ